MYRAPEQVRRIASIGGGPIGGGWTAHFLARGYDVTAYLHDPSELSAFRDILDTAWTSLTELGLAPEASLDRLTVSHDLIDAIAGADFVQESAPEVLDLKRTLYKTLGEIVPSDVIIGSSTSGLTMTDIQRDCTTPGRCVHSSTIARGSSRSATSPPVAGS